MIRAPNTPMGKVVTTFLRRMERLARRAYALHLPDLATFFRGLRYAATLRRRDRSTDLLHRPAQISDDLLRGAVQVLGKKVASVKGHDATRRARFLHRLGLAAFADLRTAQEPLRPPGPNLPENTP